MRKASVAISIIAAIICANYVPLLITHAEQDNCSFGPVSNTEYRDYLARASARLVLPTTTALVDDQAMALSLDRLFDDLSRDKLDVYSRIAMMHATLRAMGAEYRNTNGNHVDGGRSDPFLKAATASPTVSFNYVLDVNRLRTFLPWPREAWVIGSLAGPRYERVTGPLYPKKIGGIAFIFHGPTLERPLGFDIRADGSCPPVPSEDRAALFSLTPD
jgi:hypothetical protein